MLILVKVVTYTSIHTNFESAHPWHHLEVGVVIIIVVYQLAVDVAHGAPLRNEVEDNIAAVGADGFHYCSFNYNK